MTYQEKLKDPRWKAKVAEIKELKGNYCAQCGSEEELDIHHMVYTKADPWDEPNHHLIPLCGTCHFSEHHKINYEGRPNLTEAAMIGGFTPSQIRALHSFLMVGLCKLENGEEPEYIGKVAERWLAQTEAIIAYNGTGR